MLERLPERQMRIPPRGLGRRIASGFASLSVAILLVAALAAGTTAIHTRASTGVAPTAPPPMPVAAVAVNAVSSYEVTDRFVGRIEPARTAHIAFERAGLITAIAVEEGEIVAQGAPIATLDTAQLEADRMRLVAERDRLAADRELASLTEQRQIELNAKGHASQQVLDEARLRRASLDGAIAASEAAIARLDVDIAKSTIDAPFAGTIGMRHVDPGTVVEPGMPLVSLLETGRPQARVGLSPSAAAALKPGDAVEVVAGSRALSGTVVAVRPDLSATTRTVPVLVDIGPDEGLSFGDTITLAIDREVTGDGIFVPLDALKEGERGLWTVLTAERVADAYKVGRESVELIHITGDEALVRGTLRPGQRVIATGRHRVIPGQRVAPVALVAAGRGAGS